MYALPWILLKSVSKVSHPMRFYCELTFPSQVKNFPVSLKPFVLMTLSIDETDSSVLMMPSTSHPTDTLAISLKSLLGSYVDTRNRSAHVATSPGCIAKIDVLVFFLCSSTAICRSIWFRAAFDAAYAANL